MKTIPLRRYGEPEEFGRVAAFVLSPAASFVSGVMLPVDGGMLRALWSPRRVVVLVGGLAGSLAGPLAPLVAREVAEAEEASSPKNHHCRP